MSFDYFYGQQSDLFTFYRVPKVLLTNERFWNISADAKMLYGILLDRMSLSAKNGWIDKNGRVYIIFTIDEAKMALNCAEQMFMVTFLVLNTGRTEQELENNVFQAQSIAQKHNCNLRRLDFQQESGLMSSLPLAQNLIEIRRGLTTSSTAIFVPFTTQELFQNGGETLYYGLNALSNNPYHGGQKEAQEPQRTDSGYSRFR